jgi:ABC-type uncharacterized transport system substrate-binding protein
MKLLSSRHDRGRRDFLAAVLSTAAAPLAAAPRRKRRGGVVGILMPFVETDPEALRRMTAFEQRLTELGWTLGGNLRLDARWTAADKERTRTEAAALVAVAPDVILAGGTAALEALTSRSKTVPIVFVAVPDPVGQRLVAGLAVPGGNVTGFANLDFPVGGKWLELLKSIAPATSRVALLFNPQAAAVGGLDLLGAFELGARALSIATFAAPVRTSDEIETTLAAFAGDGHGLLVLPDDFINAERERIVRLAASLRLPAMYPFRAFTAAGGLLSYGVDVLDMYRGAASYVDRILAGAKPGDLPVQQPTRFELVINLETAKALDLTVPPALLARADEVIE